MAFILIYLGDKRVYACQRQHFIRREVGGSNRKLYAHFAGLFIAADEKTYTRGIHERDVGEVDDYAAGRFVAVDYVVARRADLCGGVLIHFAA